MPGDVDGTFVDRAEVQDFEILRVVEEKPEHVDEPVDGMLPKRQPEEESRQGSSGEVEKRQWKMEDRK